METRLVGIVLIICSVCLLTVTQLLIKARMTILGAIPMQPEQLVGYLLRALGDLPLLAGGGILVTAALCWYAGMSRLPLSIAYPMGALSYPLVLVGALFVLREPVSWPVIAGNLLILAGVATVAANTNG